MGIGIRHPRSVLVALGALLLGWIATCTPPPPPDDELAPVLLIGVDGLEWDVILPMLERGELPALAGLMERGSFGLLETFQPTLSPVIWTSIATGKTPGRHGILDFVKQLPGGKGMRLYQNTDRRTKALWNMASDHGKRVAVVGWWMTFPVEPINGIMVAQTNTIDQLDTAGGKQIWKGSVVSGRSGQVHPPEWHAPVMDIVARAERDLDRIVADTFGHFEQPLTPLDERLWRNCLWAFRADASYLRIAKELLAEGDPYDLFMIYFGGPDVVGHRFWRYRDPEPYESKPSRRQIAQLGDVIEDYYAYMDRSIGELIERMPGARVFVISDHGMGPINTSAEFNADDPPKDVNSGDHQSAPPGVILAAGPGLRSMNPPAGPVERSDLVRLSSVIDVAPTVLTLLGIPSGEDFKGKCALHLIEEATLEAHPPRSIRTHDTPTWREAHSQRRATNAGAGERMQQLRALGYIGEEGQDD